MKKANNNIWVGQKDLSRDEQFMVEAQQELSLEQTMTSDSANEKLKSNRRDFLRFLGFGLGAATIAAGCETPVKRAIPYVVKPDSIVPGVATYYATSYVDGCDFASILVKTREGRPIKIEGNDMAPGGFGGTSARVQAAVLSLYDTNRLKAPLMKSEGKYSETNWEDLDKRVKASLKSSSNVRILTQSIISPTAMKAVGEFAEKYPSTKVVSLDAVSMSGLLDANEANFGKRAMPSYHFDKAEVIVSFNADFLGTWGNSTHYSVGYVKNRKVDANNPKMSRHFQVESHMSLTGSNADNRILVKPSEQGLAIAFLYNNIVGGGPSTSGLNAKAQSDLTKVATQLKAASGKSIVVSGSNNVSEQLMVNAINNALSNYGSTMDMNNAVHIKQGNDTAFDNLVNEMNSGQVDCLIINDINPSYFSPMAEKFNAALSKVKTKVAFGMTLDETNNQADYIALTPHFLESWGDAMPSDTILGVIQPTIAPLFKSRQMEASLLVWAESANYDSNAEQPYYDYLKSSWQGGAFANQSDFASFSGFWNNALHNGLVMVANHDGGVEFTASADINNITKSSGSELEISFFETVNMGNGQYAGNPWLMEMPNPIDRTSWGNYLAVPVSFDGVRSMVGMNDLNDGDMVKLTIDGTEYTVPVIQQFGQMPGTVAIALGYGRTKASPTGRNVGINVNSHVKMVNGGLSYASSDVSVSNKIGTEDEFSCVQYHHTYGVKGEDKASGTVINADEAATVFFDYFTGVAGFQGALTDRSVIYTSNVKDLKDDIAHLQKKREHAQFLNSKQIYGGHDDLYNNGHHWGMYVDLNSCIGCGACTVSCMAENNVPVVGKEEVSRHHEMTWLRIDRYYYGDVNNPNVVYQPMMCQHCDNAPCENVCPVNATNHSSEGLNQMTYNRCIGTRYCANNCPYKVRRFNWLDYTTADIFLANQVNIAEEDIPFGGDNLTRMVLNPDVTVRSRGVIEKCSFCVQRIQEGKLTAKREGRMLKDGEVKSACQTACPTGAITFGDINDKKSQLSKKIESPLTYIALEEVNVRSSVNYTMKVNNRDESLDA